MSVGLSPAMQRVIILERLALNDVNRAEDVRRCPSGKAVNAARAAKVVLRRLADPALADSSIVDLNLRDAGASMDQLLPVASVVCTGANVLGESGNYIRAELNRLGILHDFSPMEGALSSLSVRAPADQSSIPSNAQSQSSKHWETRTCTTLVDRSARTATEIVEEPNPLSEEVVLSVLDSVSSLLTGSKKAVLLCSGSLPFGTDPAFYAECCRRANAHGALAVVDAKGASLLSCLKHRPFLVKPNLTELAETYALQNDEPPSLGKALRWLTQQDGGARHVFVSCGSKDAFLYFPATDASAADASRTAAFRFQIPHLSGDTLVSPIGAGDCFAGALAAMLSWSLSRTTDRTADEGHIAATAEAAVPPLPVDPLLLVRCTQAALAAAVASCCTLLPADIDEATYSALLATRMACGVVGVTEAALDEVLLVK